jgi:hypothetical protein
MAVYHNGLVQAVKLLVRKAKIEGSPYIGRIFRYRRLKKRHGLLGFIIDKQFLPPDKGTLPEKNP